MDNQKEPKKEEKRNTGRVILLIIALVCLIAGLAYIGVDLYQQYTARPGGSAQSEYGNGSAQYHRQEQKAHQSGEFQKAAKPK